MPKVLRNEVAVRPQYNILHKNVHLLHLVKKRNNHQSNGGVKQLELKENEIERLLSHMRY